MTAPIPPIDNPQALRVLVVDDSSTNCLVAAAMLRALDVGADTATSATQAVAMIGTVDYALILMDLSLGDRNGISAAREIRALGGHNREVPIVALTAHSAATEREACLAAGMNDFMQKPIEIRALSALVRRWCGAASAEREKIVSPPGSRVSDLDIEAFEALRQGVTPAGLTMLVSRFVAETENRIERLRVAAASQDHATLALESHALKSGAALFGALGLSQAAADIEALAHRLGDAVAAVETLATLAKAARAWLRSLSA